MLRAHLIACGLNKQIGRVCRDGHARHAREASTGEPVKGNGYAWNRTLPVIRAYFGPFCWLG
jgi:hypothetical protein